MGGCLEEGATREILVQYLIIQISLHCIHYGSYIFHQVTDSHTRIVAMESNIRFILRLTVTLLVLALIYSFVLPIVAKYSSLFSWPL